MNVKGIALSTWILMLISFIFGIIFHAGGVSIFVFVISVLISITLFILFIVYLVGVNKHAPSKLLKAGGILGIILYTLDVIFWIVLFIMSGSIAAQSGITGGISESDPGVLLLATIILIHAIIFFILIIATFIVMVIAWVKAPSGKSHAPGAYGQQGYSPNPQYGYGQQPQSFGNQPQRPSQTFQTPQSAQNFGNVQQPQSFGGAPTEKPKEEKK